MFLLSYPAVLNTELRLVYREDRSFSEGYWLDGSYAKIKSENPGPGLWAEDRILSSSDPAFLVLPSPTKGGRGGVGRAARQGKRDKYR